MAVRIDRDNCIECEACLAVCESGALYKADTQVEVATEKCTDCDLCLNECPNEALIKI